jgi:hypothetical protein
MMIANPRNKRVISAGDIFAFQPFFFMRAVLPSGLEVQPARETVSL